MRFSWRLLFVALASAVVGIYMPMDPDQKEAFRGKCWAIASDPMPNIEYFLSDILPQLKSVWAVPLILAMKYISRRTADRTDKLKKQQEAAEAPAPAAAKAKAGSGKKRA